MAREITMDDWPALVGDEDLIAHVGGQAFLRGQRYAEEGRVRNVAVSGGGDILTAQVLGSGGMAYQTMLFARHVSGALAWSGSCSCPVGGDCKHVAAVLVAARRLAVAEVDGAQDWELALRDLLRVSEVDTRAMALEVSTVPRPGWYNESGLSLLPLIEGKRGWNRQGAAWNQVLSGSLRGEVDDAVLLAVQEIGRMAPNGFYYADDRVALDDVPGRVWEVLRRGVAAGLTLTTAQKDGAPVRIEPGLRAGVSVTVGDDGDAVISPILDVSGVEGLAVNADDGGDVGGGERSRRTGGRGGRNGLAGESAGARGEILALGGPVHGFYTTRADGALVLMPLDPPPDEVLSRVLASPSDRITIPASDVARFEAEHLASLLRAVPVITLDERITVPEPTQLRAVLRIRLDASRHEARTSWWMRYTTTDGGVRALAELDTLESEPSEASGLSEASGPTEATGSASIGAAEAAPSSSGNRTRDPLAERRLAREIITALIPLAANHGILWRSRSMSGMETARFVTGTLPALQQMDLFDVEVDGEVPDYHEALDEPLVTTEVADEDDSTDWFSLRVRVSVGEEQIPLGVLMSAVAAGDREVLLESGAWVDIDRPEIHRLARLMDEGRELEDPRAKGTGTMRVTPFQAGYYQELVALGVVEESSRRWREGVGRLLAMTRPAADCRAGGDAAGAAESAEAAEAARRADGAGAARGADSAEGGGGTAGAEGAGSAGGARGAAEIDVPVPTGLSASLRPYQLDGYRWLNLLRSAGLGGILADDMGLGKTLQVLAAVQRMVEDGDAGREGVRGPVLVVAPTSVVGAWVEQAARFCPGLRVSAVTRTAAKRKAALTEIVAQSDVVVTSYTMVRLEEDELTAVDWSWVVLDEAQFIKNHTSATYKAARRLRAPSTVAITGTPLENSLMDLWSLMSAAAPGLLPGPDRFTAVYRRPIERGGAAAAQALASLRTRIHPFMLRRTKEEVAAELPEKTEQVIAVELGAAHRRAYDARLIRERQKVMGLLDDDSAQARFSALKSLTTLRLMALDPQLVEDGAAAGAGDADGAAGAGAEGAGGAGAEGGGAAGGGGASGSGSAGAGDAGGSGGGGGRRSRTSAKVEVLLETLRPVVAEGHKALVFSQFTRYLRGVREELEAAGMRTAYLDGSTSDRQGVIDSFRAGEADVFLISLKAGGFGLTLTEADYVFLLDPWWNPQAEEQAVDRVHRIGQDKPVLVYRLVSQGTIEEKVMTLKDKKAALFDRVVEGVGEQAEADGAAAGASGSASGQAMAPARASRAQLTAQEIRDLLSA